MHPNTSDLETIRGALKNISSKIGIYASKVICIRTSPISKTYFKNKYNYSNDYKNMFRLKYCIMVYTILHDRLDKNDIIFDDAFYNVFKSLINLIKSINNNYRNALGTELFNQCEKENLEKNIKLMSSNLKVSKIIGIK